MRLLQFDPITYPGLAEEMQALRERCGVDRTGLFRFDSAQGLLQGVIGTDEAGAAEDCRGLMYHCRSDAGGYLSRVALELLPYHLAGAVESGVPADPDFMVAAVAIKSDDSVVGVLAADNKISLRPLSREQITHLSELASAFAPLLNLLEVVTAEDLLPHVMDLLTDGICVTVSGGSVLHCNEAFARMYGCSPQDMVGLHGPWLTRSVTKNGDADAQGQMEMAASRDEWCGETCNYRLDGSLFPVRLQFRWMRPRLGLWCRLIVARDLTQERKLAETEGRYAEALEQQVRERTAQLEASNAELESFAYSIAHDLRGPLRGIDGLSSVLLEDHASQIDAEGQSYLRRIRSGIQRMGHLMDDILSLSRVVRMEMRHEPVDLTPLGLEVAAEIQEAAPRSGASIIVRDNLKTWGDPRLLRVLLQNLLDNAWKYTSRQAQAHIELSSSDTGVFYVQDDGVGFDMQYAGKLFKPFERLHAPVQFEGSGIGLAIVQRIVQRHGGRVWTESQPGQGATFYFTLASE